MILLSIIEFHLKDAIDILLVAMMLYYVYRLMKASGSMNAFLGILFFIILWFVVSRLLEMELLGAILDKLVSVGVLALIVIFQDEIRRFLQTIGTQRKAYSLFRLFLGRRKDSKSELAIVTPIVRACQSMSRQKVGALIIIEKHMQLGDIVNTGEEIDALVSERLIENIFFKNSPLHDGAMIISGMKIRAAGCLLPVAHDQDIPNWLGLRHRAALGITQVSDAMSIVVSEETGGITVARQGLLSLDITSDELDRLLIEVLSE